MATPRQRTIFVVTALGAFMASLDLSIVNVAFPAMERSFPDRQPGHPGLGHHRLRHRVRVAASHRRAGRPTAWQPPGVLRRIGHLLPRLGPLRLGPIGPVVGARPGRAGGGGGGAAALIARTAARGLPAGAPFPDRGAVGWRGRPGGRHRTLLRRRPHRRRRLALGVRRQRAHRRGGLAGRPAGTGRVHHPGLGRGPRLSRRGPDQRGAGRPRPRHLPGPDLGVVLSAGAGLLRRRRRRGRGLPPPVGAASRTGTRPDLFRSGRSAWPTQRPSSTPWASSPCCSATSCS